ncbi:PhoX family protein [Streptomyces chumphonensis]|uniref:PhoX family protein n=1 Tax=Streptomyces chumphonensis TaxID=1214925 RepID=UPI003D743C0E
MTTEDEAIGTDDTSRRPQHGGVHGPRRPHGTLSRRRVLGAGAGAFAGALALSTPAAALRPVAAGSGRPGARPGFAPVPVGEADALVVPEGHTAEVLAPWGDPLAPSGPSWAPDGRNTAAEQALQIGSHHHGIAFFPLPAGGAGSDGQRGVLAISHEGADPALLGADAGKVLAAQGVTLVEVTHRRRADGTSRGWRTVGSPRNRRITGATPVAFSGPAAEDPRLASGRAPRGALACSGHGVTPWGTYLASEENANAYFGTSEPQWQRSEADVRYGLSRNGFGHPLHRHDRRFDLAAPEQESERFGWVVEIDPLDGRAVPVKRTALGRFAHGGATVVESAGRVVVYSADAEDGEYLYKFVGEGRWRDHRAAGRSPLDHGTLYVARFADEGTGEWLPLVQGRGALTADGGWPDQAEVLIRTRLAADALGATRLDRPERVAVRRPGEGFLALPGGSGGACCEEDRHSGHGVRAASAFGQVLRWTEEAGDATARRFGWERFVSGGTSEAGPEGAFAAPKGLWFDGGGRLWISTGVSGAVLNSDEGGHDAFGNNALLAADPGSGEVRRFLTGPRGAEITGVTAAPDGRTLFVNVQHPGERTTRWGSPARSGPRAVSDWPDRDPGGRPRSATVAVRRVDGGVVGA